jgi:hypothetical protein
MEIGSFSPSFPIFIRVGHLQSPRAQALATRPNQKESIFQRLAGRLGLTYSRSRRWRKRQVCEVFLCATMFYSWIAVRSNVLSQKVKKPFDFWRESR